MTASGDVGGEIFGSGFFDVGFFRVGFFGINFCHKIIIAYYGQKGDFGV